MDRRTRLFSASFIRRLPCLSMLVVAFAYGAGAPAATQQAVEHLLKSIERSDCVFIRNGLRHPAQEAAAHMRKKYRSAQKKINTPEEFIEHAASRSSLSGKPYLMQCDNAPAQPAGDWLKAELARYRK